MNQYLKSSIITLVFWFVIPDNLLALGLINNSTDKLCVSITSVKNNQSVCKKNGKFASFICAPDQDNNGNDFNIVVKRENSETKECIKEFSSIIKADQMIIVDKETICCCADESKKNCPMNKVQEVIKEDNLKPSEEDVNE